MKRTRKRPFVVGTALVAAIGAVMALAAPANALVRPAGSPVCNTIGGVLRCDGRDPALASGDVLRLTSVTPSGRHIELHVDNPDDMAWANLTDGAPKDKVWLDRSYDGGFDRDTGSQLGLTSVPFGTSWRTLMYNVDDFNPIFLPGIYAVRACGQAVEDATATCTMWARTTWNGADPGRAAATALMSDYNADNGQWRGSSWWQQANDLTSIIDNVRASKMGSYQWVIALTFFENRYVQGGQDNVGRIEFQNDWSDDTAWWALAWLDAYDLTGNRAYLNTAIDDANYINNTFWDSRCGGGILQYDSTVTSPHPYYKATVANELNMELDAELHNRIPGDTGFLSHAVDEYNWLTGDTDLIPSSGPSANLIYDGVYNCNDLNAQHWTYDTHFWTYNQGVMLAGLSDLYSATGDAGYLTKAQLMADASTTNSAINVSTPDGLVLNEPCNPDLVEHTPGACAPDGPTFKGAYIRGLSRLNSTLQDHPYTGYIVRQAKVAYADDRNPFDQYGTQWQRQWCTEPHGTPDPPLSDQQSSALDALNAALPYGIPLAPKTC